MPVAVAASTEPALLPPGRRGRPPRAVADQVERRLLDAARGVFVQCGFENATMDAVAAAARTSKRTLYGRFASKEQLFAAVVTDHIARSFTPVHDALADVVKGQHLSGCDTPLRECLVKLGHVFVEQAIAPESQALDRAVFAAAHVLPELADRLHQDGFVRAINIVNGLLEQAGARQAQMAAQAFYSLLVLTPMRGDSPRSSQPLPEVEAVVDFVLAGAQAAPAQR